jgi:hypothetical protein
MEPETKIREFGVLNWALARVILSFSTVRQLGIDAVSSGALCRFRGGLDKATYFFVTLGAAIAWMRARSALC